eukprot:2880608-Rhodomonas_salina.2
MRRCFNQAWFRLNRAAALAFDVESVARARQFGRVWSEDMRPSISSMSFWRSMPAPLLPPR